MTTEFPAGGPGLGDETAVTNMDVEARAVRRSGLVLVGWVCSTGGSALIGVALAHLLDPTDVGVFYLSWSAVTFASIAARFGMDAAAVRLLAPLRAAAAGTSSVYRRTTALSALGAAAVGIALAAGLWRLIAVHGFHSAAAGRLGPAVGVLAAAIAVEGTALGWLQGLQRMRAVAAFNVSTPLLWGLALGVTAATTNGISAEDVLLARAATSLVLVCATCLAVRMPIRGRGPRVIGLRELLDLGASLMASRLISTVTGAQSDLWILGAFAPAADVGGYAIAASVSLIVAAPFMAANVVLGPMIAEMYGRSRADTERLIRTATGVTLLPTLAATAVLVALGRPLLGAVYGASYRGAATILAVFCLTQCVFVVTGPCGLALMMTGHHRAASLTSLAAATCSTAADIWAAPRYGAVGVAIATNTVLVFDNVLVTLLARRLTGMWTFARVRRADLRQLRRNHSRTSILTLPNDTTTLPE